MVYKKTVHDGNKRKDASVTMHGQAQLPPNAHWEVNLDATPAGKNDAEGAFLPKKAKDRPQPHTKINECDH